MKRFRLADRRKAVGLSQEKLAEILWVDRSTIVRWERAATKPQPWHRPKLACALQISTDELTVLLAGDDDTSTALAGGDDLASVLDRAQDGAVDRRSFLPIAALPMVGGLSAIVELLTPLKSVGDLSAIDGAGFSLAQAQRQTAQAKTLYQACCYQESLRVLPGLLGGLTWLTANAEPSLQPRLNTLAA